MEVSQMKTTNKPNWNDDRALAKYVARTIDEIESENERQFYNQNWDTYPGITASEWVEIVEETAVKEANRGNAEYLAGLVHPKSPLNVHRPGGKPIREQLQPATWRLIADIMVGRHKRRVGRPKKSADERKQDYPVHNAAAEVRTIKRILGNCFPDRDPSDIHDRALEVAACRHHVRAETIRNYLKRPKSRRLG
jgi:hypothetical protein